MKFLDSFKGLFKPDQIEHEAIDLKTGKAITLVKVRQQDGSYVIKRVKDSDVASTPKFEAATTNRELKPPEESVLNRFKPDLSKIKLPKKKGEKPVKKEVSIKETVDIPETKQEKVDLMVLLENDIDKAIKIKQERDLLADKLKEFEGHLQELDEHKTARKDAESKVTAYEDSIVSLKEEKADLEKSIIELKEDRDEIKEKIRHYEAVLTKIKDKIVAFDEKIA